MRRTLQRLHSLTLRLIGLYGLAHVAIWLIYLDSFAQQNMGHPLPLTVLSLFVALCTLCAFRHAWAPRALVRPSVTLHILAFIPTGLLVWFLFFLATTMCISMAQLDEPFQRNIAFLSAFISFVLLTLSGLFGTALSLLPAKDDDAPPARRADPFARL